MPTEEQTIIDAVIEMISEGPAPLFAMHWAAWLDKNRTSDTEMLLNWGYTLASVQGKPVRIMVEGDL